MKRLCKRKDFKEECKFTIITSGTLKEDDMPFCIKAQCSYCGNWLVTENVQWNLYPNGRVQDRIKREDLVGRLYDCICNLETGGFSTPIKHHFHRIRIATEINADSDIRNGLALTINHPVIFGCREEDIK